MADQGSKAAANVIDDAGGVPFDDDFDNNAPRSPASAADGNLPAYDSGTILQSRGIGYPTSTPVGMSQLRSYVLGRWQGADLGILSIPPRGDARRQQSEPAQLGHGVGLAMGQPRSWAGHGRRGDRLLHRQCRCARNPGCARLRGLPLLEVVPGLGRRHGERLEWVRAVVGAVAPHRAHLGGGKRQSFDRGSTRRERCQAPCLVEGECQAGPAPRRW